MAALWCCSLGGLIGCSDDEALTPDAGSTCLMTLDTTCDPPWDPTFDQLFGRVISESCSSPATGNQCHGSAGGASGLFLFDPDDAYDALVNGHGNGPPVVVPFEPECSELIQRLESTKAGYGMPIGGQLEAGKRCAFVRWVAAGAKRSE